VKDLGCSGGHAGNGGHCECPGTGNDGHAGGGDAQTSTR
jgi:hypothetical protein